LRANRWIVIGLSHEKEQPPHVAQRLGVCVLDRAKCLANFTIIDPQHLSGTASLQDRDRDGMGHHIVELPCDPRTLLGHGLSSAFFELRLEHPILVGERQLVVALQPDGEADGPWSTDDCGQHDGDAR
jgi:hypothetical protein